MGKRYDSFKLAYFSKKNGEITTIIGVQDNAITSPYLLASRMSLSVSRFENFKIVNDKINVRIKGDYTVSFAGEYIASTNITYFDDVAGSIKSVTRFMFNLTPVTFVNLPEMTTTPTTFVRGVFANTPNLSKVIIPKLDRIRTDGIGFFYNAGANDIECDLSNIVQIVGYKTFEGSKFKTLDLSNLTEYIDTSSTSGGFSLMPNIEYINMRKLKSFTLTYPQNKLMFNGSKKNALLEVNIDFDISVKGVHDDNIMNAYCLVDYVVDFYDDNNGFVKTLAPNPNVTIEFTDNTYDTKDKLRSLIGSGLWFGNYQFANNIANFYLHKDYSFNNTFRGSLKIKKFIDNSGIIVGGTAYMRELFNNATNLEVFESNSVKYLNNYVFQNTKITNLYLPSLIWIGAYCFYGMPRVTRIECPLLETPLEGGGNQAALCPMLEEFVAPLLKYINQGFYQDCTSLKRAIHNESTYIKERAFFNCTSIELIEAKRCKSIGSSEIDVSNVFNNIKTGCHIHVHIDNKTNYNGGLNYDLAYARDVRGAIIHFYDDELNLIETI